MPKPEPINHSSTLVYLPEPMNSHPYMHSPELFKEIKKAFDFSKKHTENPEGGLVPKLLVCTGIAGIGKSEQAVVYAFSEQRYSKKVWFPAWDRATLMASYQSFMRTLGVDEDLSDDKILAFMLAWFANESDWLAIYDDVNKHQEIQSLLPSVGKGHIFITCRVQAQYGLPFQPHYQAMDLMSARDAETLISSLLSIKDSRQAQLLAERLGFLPLALIHACTYINRTKDMSIPKYLDAYDKDPATLLIQSARPAGLNPEISIFEKIKSQFATFYMSQPDSYVSSYATQLLSVLTYFSPEAIPSILLKATNQYLYPVDPKCLDTVLLSLGQHSLIQHRQHNQQSIYQMPPIAQVVFRNMLREPSQKEACLTCAADILRSVIFSEKNSLNPSAIEMWLSHVFHIERRALELKLSINTLSSIKKMLLSFGFSSTISPTLAEPQKIYILFLDIDGVLKYLKPKGYQYRLDYFKSRNITPTRDDTSVTLCKQTDVALFNKGALRNVYDLIDHIEATGIKVNIVLSSSWRRGRLKNQIIKMMKKQHPILAAYLTDKTPDVLQVVYDGKLIESDLLRGHEIYAWLAFNYNKYHIVQFAIIDDIDLQISPIFFEHFIQCNDLFGPTEFKKAIDRFESKKALALKGKAIDWNRLFRNPDLLEQTTIGLCNHFSEDLEWYEMQFPTRTYLMAILGAIGNSLICANLILQFAAFIPAHPAHISADLTSLSLSEPQGQDIFDREDNVESISAPGPGSLFYDRKAAQPMNDATVTEANTPQRQDAKQEMTFV